MAFVEADWRQIKRGIEPWFGFLTMCIIIGAVISLIYIAFSKIHDEKQDDKLCFNDMNLNDARRKSNGELFCRVSDKHPWIKYEKPTQDQTN